MAKNKKISHINKGINWSQTKAIMMRDLKLNMRELRFVMVFLVIQFIIPGGFFYTGLFKHRTAAYYSMILLNGALSRNVITNYVLEREKKFRTTFKLMGIFLYFNGF